MPNYDKFEDLPVWQEAASLYNKVLDFLEQPGVPLTPTFRNQLDRAALSVLNNIVGGFERETASEQNASLAIARGSADDVRSMMAVVKDRSKLKPFVERLEEIRSLAESCAWHLAAWMASIEDTPGPGKRYPIGEGKEKREASEKAREFRLDFLRNLKPEHPLYGTPEARAARGEPMGE